MMERRAWSRDEFAGAPNTLALDEEELENEEWEEDEEWDEDDEDEDEDDWDDDEEDEDWDEWEEDDDDVGNRKEGQTVWNAVGV